MTKDEDNETRSTRTSSPAARCLLIPAVMWSIFAIQHVLPGGGAELAVRSWDWSHWWGIGTYSFVHSSWAHIFSNTFPLVILGFLLARRPGPTLWIVTGSAAAVSGLAVFFLNPAGVLTLGASGIVFGYFAFLVARPVLIPGHWREQLANLVVAALVIGLYGSAMLSGIIPTGGPISWQGHLFGALGGVAAAALLRRRSEPQNN